MSVTQQHLANTRGSLCYRVEGRGEWVVFCHALATDQSLWESQVRSLSATHSVLTYDLRGHGESAVATDGNYSFDAMAGDIVALMNHLDIERTSVMGISVGGEIAQMFASLYPERINALLLASTACFTSEARAALWKTRIAKAEVEGMRSIAASSVPRWFSEAYRVAHPHVVDAWQQRISTTSIDAYVGMARTIQTMDLRPRIGKLVCDTHIICGSEDENTGPAVAQGLAALITGATLDVISCVGHFPNIEAPEEFNQWLKSRLYRAS